MKLKTGKPTTQRNKTGVHPEDDTVSLVLTSVIWRGSDSNRHRDTTTVSYRAPGRAELPSSYSLRGLKFK